MAPKFVSYCYPQACVAMFAKEPVVGGVKTRLIPALGSEGAKNLHVQLLKRQIGVLEQSNLCEAQLWVDNNPDHQAFSGFSGTRKIQQGGDLGEKMYNTLACLLDDFEYALLIGSDCPAMDETYLRQAVAALQKGAEVVLGPAADGGYVLIAARNIIPEIFHGVKWGSSSVLEDTRRRLQDNNVKWFELPELFDIDTPEDLVKML